MRPLLATALGFALGWTPPAFAAGPAPDPHADLVEKLGDPSFADREAAGRALLKFGPAALPALDKAAGSPDAETRTRAADLADRIRRAEDNAKRLAAPAVTLDYTGVPLGSVVADLKTKTGIPLVLDPVGVADPMRNVTLKTGPLPPWEAVEAVCKAAGLREVFRADLSPPKREVNAINDFRRRRFDSYYPPDGTPLQPGAVPVVLADGKFEPLPGSRGTAVRVLAMPAAFPANRIVRGSGEVVISLDVTPTPAAQWQSATGVRVHRATDETGRNVSVAHNTDPGPSPFDEDGNFNGFIGGVAVQLLEGDGVMGGGPKVNPRVVPVRLRTGDRQVGRLKVLEGVVVGETVIPNQPLATIDDLAKNTGLTVHAADGTKLTLVAFEVKSDGRVLMRVRTENPNVWNNVGAAVRMLAGGRNGIGQLKFFDAAGKPVRQPSIQESMQNDDGLTVTNENLYSFPRTDAAGRPTKLVLVGNKPMTLEVPFRLENVRLP